MIVTSIPRSGSTKFCYELAQSLGYDYQDEIFDLGIDPKNKQDLHEFYLPKINPDKSAAFLKSLDFNKSVINNHEMNYFILEKTDIFLSRQNVQDAVWSYIAYTTNLNMKYGGLNFDKSQEAVAITLSRRLIQMNFFYDYCVTFDKPITIPDLEFNLSEKIREKFKHFKTLIDDAGKTLKLPKGLIYE
jgi:hypothetical protein